MQTFEDDLGLALTCGDEAAASAYRRAADGWLHAWPGVREGVDEAVRHDPEFALAHALRALHAATWLRRAEVGPALEAARRAAASATLREQSHVAVVDVLLGGRPGLALNAALEHMSCWPTDALLATTMMGAFGLFAFSGRADHDAARLTFVRQLAPHYPAEHAWLLSHLGWSCIEAGEVDEGLEFAQRSFGLRRENGNIAHVLMHGFYERDDPADALAFIDDWLPGYSADAMLWGHLQWHAALAELELGREDAALVRFTQAILPRLNAAPPLVGLSDAASLMWRLRLRDRQALPWAAAAAQAARHFAKGGNAFAEVHLAMLAAGRADRQALAACAERLRILADKGHAAAPVALNWTVALSAQMEGDAAAAIDALQTCQGEVARLGGSHAQRAVVALTLARLAEG